MNTRTHSLAARCNTRTLFALAALAVALIAPAARAEIIGGVDFPKGPLSFADAVTSYTPVVQQDPATLLDVPDARWRVPTDALGTPNYTPPVGPLHNEGQFVSLGNGGVLVVQFVDNALTGSGDSDLDLWIFEVGPEVEAMSVEISTNGSTWLSVGSIGGATAGVDVDAYGVGIGQKYYYVRLTDDVNQFPASTPYDFWAGADIDAVGAISTIENPDVPEPATMTLIAVGGVMALIRHRRRIS